MMCFASHKGMINHQRAASLLINRDTYPATPLQFFTAASTSPRHPQDPCFRITIALGYVRRNIAEMENSEMSILGPGGLQMPSTSQDDSGMHATRAQHVLPSRSVNVTAVSYNNTLKIYTTRQSVIDNA
jgi:hypothetical protein